MKNFFKQILIDIGTDFETCSLLPKIDIHHREIEIVWIHFYIDFYFPKGNVFNI